MTANGRPLSSADHLARNGVIHIISSVMSSVYQRQVEEKLILSSFFFNVAVQVHSCEKKVGFFL